MSKVKLNYNGAEHAVWYADDWIQSHVLNGVFFEQALLDQVKERVTDFTTVIDIGANVGNHSYFFKNICNAGTVHAFEPVPSNCIQCRKNLPNDFVYEMALSNYNGLTSIENHHPHNSGTGRMVSTTGTTTVKTFDSLNIVDVTFVKIDVEGEELAVLEGMRETLLKYKPEMLLELHPPVTIQRVMELLPVDYTFENLTGIEEEDIDDKTVCNYFLKPRQ
tara:strand:- start:4504 stop:5163 length:660 start_codon:yes stop_codon:yes gene_type:complete